MPHQCTSCGRTFADGSKEMLSGCPDCGGNKFQFMPAEAVDGDAGGGRATGGDRATGGGPATGGDRGTSGERTTGERPGSERRGLTAGGTAPKKRPADSDAPDSAPAGETSATGDARDVAPETVGESAREVDAGNSGSDGRETDDRGAVNRAAATVREWVGSGGKATDADVSPDSADSATDAASRAADETPEDSAQASARRDVVSDDELPEDPPRTARGRTDGPASTGARDPDGESVPADASADDAVTPTDPPATAAPGDDATAVDPPDDRNPGLAELREELNSQFESIRIVEPGQYELNLMELYEREEYIISLQEDGKYVIEVPDAWDAPER